MNSEKYLFGRLLTIVLLLSAACASERVLPTPLIPTPSPQPSLTATPTRTATPLPPPSATPTSQVRLCSPISGRPLAQLPSIITQPFILPSPNHDPQHPEFVRKDDGHHGVDLGYYSLDGKQLLGTPVRAALEGRIAAVIHNRPPYGNMVMIETPYDRIPSALRSLQQITPGDSLYIVYAHMQYPQTFQLGDSVTCGDQLGEVGLTGFTSGPHLHFETRWGPPGWTFAVMAFYTADETKQEAQNYETWRLSAIFHLFDPMQLLTLKLP